MTHESLLRGPRESQQAFGMRMEREMGVSKRQLERFTGKSITAFAFPFGWHQAEHLPLLRKLGYAAAFTVNPGVNGPSQDPLLLKRQSVFRLESPRTLAAKLLAMPASSADVQPPELSMASGHGIRLTARGAFPCEAMWLDFQRVPHALAPDGTCLSGPIDLEPGFHTVAIQSQLHGGQGMTS
ncbi:MAG: polysaccharide deacetylase family protein [Candidatus Sericytochromatia bacterium]|nr:polysaccharide deacetylase family protein [Candidatus Sericytochromatia bacterium]